MEHDLYKFVDAATELCSFVDNIDRYSGREQLHTAAQLLANLYFHTVSLPDVQPTERDNEVGIGEVSWKSFSDVDIYWGIFDPYNLEQPSCGSLSDDIRDIYLDVKKGLLIFQGGADDDIVDAIWHWRFSFHAHWGYHLVDALRAIHWAMLN